MNKIEKLISILLAVGLVYYFVHNYKTAKTRAAAAAQAPVVQAQAAKPAQPAAPAVPAETAPQAPVVSQLPALPMTPEEVVTLENEDLSLTLSSWGAVIESATAKQYAVSEGPISEANPAVSFDFQSSPLGALTGAPVLPTAAYTIVEQTSNSVTFARQGITRKYTLGAEYQITLEETFSTPTVAESRLSLGAIETGTGKNDLLSVDSWVMNLKGGEVIHHGDTKDSPLKPWLVGSVGGCSGAPDATNLPRVHNQIVAGAQKWIAVKNRFFVTALASSTVENQGFATTITRDATQKNYRPKSVAAAAIYPAGLTARTSVFYVGPKKQALLGDLGMRDVMEFGMWRWICYPLVWVLNLFYAILPNYGIAIILLTILVRLLFWPLTHKSTVGMKRMQELQPLLKEVQTKYKDNPQRMQQEIWSLYREKKVNPLSSCLPMLIQIPVFIALFNVLRSAVELRYAPFLWIADLSEPERLFASVFPFGGLNILPILMAVTMALQSALTPSTGDQSQKRMMMIIMPVMMLVMFYSFPSALSLYWTLSQVLSIVQMWLIRRSTAKQSPAVEVIEPERMTRQMRRHAK